MADQLVRLVYYSRALDDMSLTDIQSILTVARENNQKLGICGMLCYESQWFLQTLEGPRGDVNDLYLEIAEDPRHYDIRLTAYEEIDAPHFTNWQMGYAGSSGEFSKAISEMGLESFEPPEMNAEQSLGFLKKMSFI